MATNLLREPDWATPNDIHTHKYVSGYEPVFLKDKAGELTDKQRTVGEFKVYRAKIKRPIGWTEPEETTVYIYAMAYEKPEVKIFAEEGKDFSKFEIKASAPATASKLPNIGGGRNG